MVRRLRSSLVEIGLILGLFGKVFFGVKWILVNLFFLGE